MPVAARQVRDAGSVPSAAGHGSIAGVVRESGPDQRPVGRALIMATIAGQAQGAAAVTDDAGRFVIQRVPAGQLSITATKSGYLQGAYGAAMPGRAGIPIVLAAGQQI